jgi:hypothetical protein
MIAGDMFRTADPTEHDQVSHCREPALLRGEVASTCELTG